MMNIILWHVDHRLVGPGHRLLHMALKGATYAEILEALEDSFGDQHLGAAYCSQLKSRTQGVGESCKNLPQPLNSWLTAPPLQNQSDNYFTAGSLLPVSSSWREAP
jgi:hypothetical protein